MIHLPVITDSERDHVRPDLCGPCGGKCCQAAPGIASPEDFGAPNREAMIQRVRAAIASGLWAVDWWDGDPRGLDYEDAAYVSRAYYVRPAIRGHEARSFHSAWGGTCTFHSADGCRIFTTRPQGCRDLVPGATSCMHASGSKRPNQIAAIAWLPYRDVIGTIFAPHEAEAVEPTEAALRRAAAQMVSYADTNALADIAHAMRFMLIAESEDERADAGRARAWMTAYEAMAQEDAA